MKILWAIVPLWFATNVSANNVWQDISARDTATASGLQHYRLLHLDETQLLTDLSQTPLDTSSTTQARQNLPTLLLPLPDGGFANVSVTPTEVLAPDMAAQHPDIQTWKVFGTDGKVISGVLDMTPQGLHAMLDMANGDTLFIDPQNAGTSRQYLSFRKSANKEAFQRGAWSCTSHAQGNTPSFARAIESNSAARTLAARAGETLHTYRIAIAATGEYTAYHGGQSAAYSSIVTMINRINQVYERDLSAKLQLVSDTNLIYTNASTDPYSNQSNLLMLDQNTATLNSVMGSSNYDIGHLLATSGGGLASVATVCGADKAEGVTGLPEPEGDAFIIDFVAHEIGHQLGASHTFNGLLGSCSNANREPLTAYEPGSGSTIMAYTGLCRTDNLQSNSDSMMHAASISQIHAYLHEGNGASCASTTSLSNSNPTVTAGADYTIPAATPFILSGTGSDLNGNTLSYSWEQLDTGTASNVNIDTGNNALIRAHLPTTTPLRTVPQMSDLIGNVKSAGEVLPVTNRLLNFRLQARDGNGGTGFDDIRINVQNTGSSFAITSPTSTALLNGSVQNITWNVAGTDLPPINCSAVDIAVSNDNGNTFSTLLSNTPNDGSATVTLPTNLSSRTYLRVKCSNNIFFAISATNPAKATAGSGSNTNTTTTPLSDSTSSGGGGSTPAPWVLLAGVYALFRLRKGILR